MKIAKITTTETVTQQALSAFAQSSDIFENNFVNNKLVRSILDDFSGTLSAESVPIPPTEKNAECHRSLGCFFDIATGQLSKILKAAASESVGFSAEESFSLYALLVSALLEKILDVSAVAGLNDGSRSYRENPLDLADQEGFLRGINARYMQETYEPMYQMRRWSYFFSHPREFGWVQHQPRFTFADSIDFMHILETETRFRTIIIDDAFIREYYEAKSTSTAIEEHVLFTNKPAVIALPNIAIITEQICECLSEFVEITATTFYYPMLDKSRRKSDTPE